MGEKTAKLILLSVPIGNLEDITQRALKTLNEEQYFFVEDTRNFSKLLDLLKIEKIGKKFYSYHDHSKEDVYEKIFLILEEQNVVIASDAGSPIISDPAYPLVKKAIEKGITVTSNPGVSSPLVALELSGLPAHPFMFHGFLGRDKSSLNKSFDLFESIEGGHFFFESPNRLMGTLEILCARFPNENIVVARELTKFYESVYRFKGHEFQDKREDILEKGEIVIGLSISKSKKLSERQIAQLGEEYLQSPTPKALSKLLSLILDRPTKEIYSYLNKK
ncbi:MAG: rRNA small subunit methyltransferase 1 [Halobacteriovoraceae bacterium]|nr:rRNA small subunit methyltransferase 1 [Halobacteriovoraceae bacterium]